MCAFQLSPNARVCVTEHGAVFLDLARGSYVGIDPDQSRALADLVEGWAEEHDTRCAPAHETSTHAAPSEPAHELAETLCGRGLLVRASAADHVAQTPALPPARAELISWEDMHCPPIRIAHLIAFVRALLTAFVMTHWRPLAATIERCSLRRTRHAPDENALDLQRAITLVSLYQYLRTWVFARRGRCLLDSLALLEFLACYRVYPRWVIGVQVRPFVAHAWLQHQHLLLNATPAFVRPYAPILIV